MSGAQNDWGRVADDGTAYVRTADGERVVGSWQADAPAEGLAFYTRRFADLETQVALLEQRLASGATAPDAATDTARSLRESITGAAAIGDLDSLLARLDALGSVVEAKRAERKAERAAAAQKAQERKGAIVTEAEKIAGSNDWRHGSNRLRDLLEEWKGLPRLDRAADDELWHRFSAARTGFTRRRKAHFAEQADEREAAKAVKQKLVAQARELSTSTEWGPTSGAMRDLMTKWKKAGRAPREVDDALWAQFREAQDAFFTARDAANAERDIELGKNLEVKRALLVEAEGLLPVTDPKAARAALRAIQDRYATAGMVPRDAMREVEQRMRTVEQAVEAANEEAWRRSNPEARARAESTVTQLTSSIASLERDRDKAVAAGRDKAAREAQDAIEARQSWLEQAQATLAEFSG
ncbi:MAG: DUF349 domain-containing protein [Jiangellales bacterium]